MFINMRKPSILTQLAVSEKDVQCGFLDVYYLHVVSVSGKVWLALRGPGWSQLPIGEI
jgi:hypothetical protein